MILTDFLKDIADAIRYAEKSSDKIPALEFPQRIRNLTNQQIIDEEIVVPKTGTWQLKATTKKKYIVISTDDDNNGNAMFFRLLRTYGFPYTMNVEAENLSKDLGSDVSEDIFSDSDAVSLFPDGITVTELGKYLYENNLGEVTQHGMSSSVLWDSANLTGTFLDSLYATYCEQGGTKTKEEMVNEIKSQLSASDCSQGATYVATSRKSIEDAMGHKIVALQIWGGVPTAIVDGIELSLNSIKGGSYDYRGNNYVFASPRVGMPYLTDFSLYNKTRTYFTTDIQEKIDEIAYGDVEDFFAHMPFNDLGNEVLRQMLDIIKANVEKGEVAVITPSQYYKLGEWTQNPIVSISLTRDTISLGDSDSLEAYVTTATYEDGTIKDVSSEAIVDNSAINTSEAGTYTANAFYRGFSAEANVNVADGYRIPDGLKDTAYWFIGKDTTDNKLIAGNTTGAFGKASQGYSGLVFSSCVDGKMCGWISYDDGATWEIVNNKSTHYKTIKCNGDGTSTTALNFGLSASNNIVFLETSGNFETEGV